MGQVDGFMKFDRELPTSRDPKEERIRIIKKFIRLVPKEKVHEQSARCMDCGVPFCHHGCPLGNNIPDFNDAVYQGKWEEAIKYSAAQIIFLSSPEEFVRHPVKRVVFLVSTTSLLRSNILKRQLQKLHLKRDISNLAFHKVEPAKRVAVVGSGPAGLAAAAQLNKAGHWVTVFERSDRIGGLLRYGIP
jgi:glutamate synthase (NADPH/NADH) small chain